jgi:hypothetical protein
MKSLNNNLSNLLKGLAVIGFGLSLAACDNAVFSSDGSNKANVVDDGGGNGTTNIDDLVFLQDSFERDDIFADLINNIIYGWRGFVLDGATPVTSFQSNGAGSSIPAAGALGPAQDGQRFLLMAGRDNGTAVETVQLITQSYDLSQYNTALITFRYMTFNLSDADDTVPENLQLQVCRGTLNECGANDDVLDPNGLLSDKWVTVFTNDQTVNDDSFNGKNHLAVDWKTGIAAIDLNNPEFVGDGSTFVMRFVGVVRDGYTPGTPGSGGGGECCGECNNHNDCDHDNHKKVLICHVPPGNPAAAHTISISENAVSAHLKHHDDYLGACRVNNDVRTVAGVKINFSKSTSSSHSHDKDHKKDCKKKHKHKKHCKKKHKHCKKDCKPCPTTPPVPADGTLKDGIAIDNVKGVATQLTIDEIF